ncbi:restriction endonuclease subunit S [Helicobacter pylori]|nr:restriction endonuclease subunit S [Helicobacter pylori]
MHKIERLLHALAPKGVEFRKLGEVCEIIRGKRVTKKEILDKGKYPVVSGGIGFMGYLNEYNREENTITIAQYGTAGFVNWQNQKFWANDVCFSVILLAGIPAEIKARKKQYEYYREKLLTFKPLTPLNNKELA